MTPRTSLLAALCVSVLTATLLTSTASAQDAPARVTVSSDARGMLSLHVRDHGGWRMLCIAPCDAEVAPGITTLGVARAGSDPVAASVVDVEDTLHLRIRYEDRSGLRVMGVVTMLASIAAGVGLGISGLETSRQGEGLALAATGIAGITLGGIAGLVMLLHGDVADVAIE